MKKKEYCIPIYVIFDGRIKVKADSRKEAELLGMEQFRTEIGKVKLDGPDIVEWEILPGGTPYLAREVKTNVVWR